ncbi:frmA [Symbiodinium natans]|uniref:FrmA protein n=1 Tax=Symbiodinium natans TaxID=878477 RepID=A0A812LNS9_9DINO|nr:frmA [Symbiodinium natans]
MAECTDAPATSVPQFAADHKAKVARRALLASAGPVTQLLIGDAIGDAFGFGVEMQDAHWMRQCVTRCTSWPENPVKREEHKFNSVRGMYSDDCEMTVGLMKALVKDGMAASEDAMLTAWREEWELAKCRPSPAVPGAERSGHGSVKYFFNGKTSLNELRESQASRVDPGNAPPMRALPLAFVDPGCCQELCRANADTTHPHPKARAASYLIAQAARWLIVEKGRKQKVLEVALERLQASDLNHLETVSLLQKIQELPDYHSFGQRLQGMPEAVHALLCGPQPHPDLENVPGGQDGTSAVHGLGSDAMRTAGVVLYILRFHRGPRDALLTSLYIGGDVDSIAALCLGIVGGSEGLQLGQRCGLPWFLVEELEGVEYLVSQASRFEAWLSERGLGTLGISKASRRTKAPSTRLKRPAAAVHKRPSKRPR